MSQVACVFGPALAEVAARGIPLEELVAGLGVHPKILANPRKRISWDAFTELIRRTSERLGTEALEDLAALSAEQAVPQRLRFLLASWGDTRPTFRMGARWWGPWIFKSTRVQCDLMADGRIREVIDILPGYRESPEFFHGVRGMLRATPLMFGQPEARVELQHDGRRGEFLIEPPPARRPPGWRRRVAARALGMAIPRLAPDPEPLRQSERRAKLATFLLAEKLRRLETIQELGRRITRHRGVRERVGAVVGLLEEAFPVRGVRLCADGGRKDTRPSDLRAESGDVSGRPSETHRLEVSGRMVGRLELWAVSEAGLAAEDRECLSDLATWISLSLDSARMAEQSHELTRLLEDEVADWQVVEQAIEQALADEPPAGEDLAGEAAGEGPEPPYGVLLVEDDAALRADARSELEAAGHVVFETESDPLALALRPTAIPIQLVIADWATAALTPEFLSQVRRLHPELRGFLLLPLRRP